jgi:hypothetical protein
LLWSVATSCNLFETRSPEEPDQSPVAFFPATNPTQLIQNFTNSIKYKRPQNYSDCLINDQRFNFSASADAFAQYQSIFNRWTYQDENRFFQSLVSNVSSQNLISISFDKISFNYASPDSIIFNANYEISFVLKQSSKSDNYAGSMQMTFVPTSDGVYKILRWSDYPSKNDSLIPTWSTLKARFYN